MADTTPKNWDWLMQQGKDEQEMLPDKIKGLINKMLNDARYEELIDLYDYLEIELDSRRGWIK